MTQPVAEADQADPPAHAKPRWLGIAFAAGFVALVAHRLLLAQANLPSVYNPDEPYNLYYGQQMVRNTTLVPQYFNYPSFIYEYGAIWHLLGKHLPLLEEPKVGPEALGTATIGGVSTYFLMRLGMVLLSVVSVWLAVRLARRLDPRWPVAAVVGVTMGVSWLVIDNSYIFTPDGPGAAFVLMALVGAAAVLFAEDDRTAMMAAIGAGAATGLAAGTKYQLALVGLAVAATFAFRFGKDILRRRETWAFVGTAAILLIISTPAVLIHPSKVIDGVRFINKAYAEGRVGQDEPTWWFNIKALLSTLGPLTLAAIYALRPGRGRDESGRPTRQTQFLWVLGGFTLVYLLFTSYPKVHFARNLTPVVAPIAILGAIGLVDIVQWVWRLRPETPWVRSAVLGVLALFLLVPVVTGFSHTRRIVGDPRAEARQWIEDNVPGGATIAIEDYAPVVDTNRWKLVSFGNSGRFRNKKPLPADVSWIVLTNQAGGAFRANPEKYRDQAIRTERILKGYCLRYEGTNLGYEAEIYERCD